VVLFGAHSLALCSICLTPWIWQLKLVFAVLLAYATHRAIVAGPAVSGLRILGSSRLVGVLADGSHVRLEICAHSTLHQQMVLMRFRIEGEGKVESLVLFPDHMLEGQFHLLRLWLRLQSEEAKVAPLGVAS